MKPIELKDFIENDVPGNYLISWYALNESGRIVATGYSCDKENCNCAGGWYNGDMDEAVKTVYRPS